MPKISRLDLLQGTLDLLILRTLQSGEAKHGWAISERIRQISENVLQANQGSLYPALHRLEHQGSIKAECRGMRGIDAFEIAWQDMRYAARSFVRNPAFVFTVSGTIALGLGLNLALFTLFNAYVLRPLSISDPYNLYSFSWSDRTG